MEHTKDCIIDMSEFANALLAPPKAVHPYIKENLNEACNRRAQLALTTFEAAMKARLYAAQEEQKGMADPFSPEYLLKSGRIAMILDLMDDMIVTRRGFQP